MQSLESLTTEARNPRTEHIDQLPTLDMLTLINQEDATVAGAVAAELPHIAKAVDAIVARFARGGRLFYIGAGTSGRLGVLDASECPPTYSVPPTLVQGIIAGGDSALRRSSEHSEDSPEEGVRDLTASGLTADDSLVGVAASGRTPYVLGAVTHARSLGALTIGLSCVAGSALARLAEIAVTPVTGPEVITGSTRMKAGTATKLVLNMLSTGVMIRTGAVYGNLMVNVQPTNDKLIDRAIRILMAASADPLHEGAPGSTKKLDRFEATHLLHEAGSIKVAIAMHKLGILRAEAESRLAAANGSLARALTTAH